MPWALGLDGVEADGAGVEIMVIGDGIDYLHPALGGVIDPAAWAANDPDVLDDGFPIAMIGGRDFAGADGLTPDDDPFVEAADPGAGGPTHATTAAVAILRTVAPGARVVVYKVTDRAGRVSLSALEAALDAALAAHPAVVLVALPQDLDGDLSATHARLARLVEEDVVVVAPAGDAGRASFELAWVNRTAEVLSVAASAPPGVPTVTLEIDTPASLAGRFGLAPLTPLTEYAAGAIGVWGCDSEVVLAPIGLVLDPTCAEAIAARAPAAGVQALLVATPSDTVESFSAPWLANAPLPVLAIDAGVAARIARTLTTGLLVSVSLDEVQVSNLRLVDTVAHLSSRGPWRQGDALRAEPELAAPGVHMMLPVAGPEAAMKAQSGTTLAAAYVAGVAALLRGARDWDGATVVARLVNSAAPLTSAQQALVAGTGEVAPVTMGGGGRVDAHAALSGGLVARVDGRALIDLGVAAVTEATQVTRRVELHNGGASALEVALTYEPRDGNDAQGGVVVALSASRLTLAPGATEAIELSVTIDPTRLRPFASRPATTTATYDAVAAWTADEVDGFLRIAPTTDAEPAVSLPLWSLPRAASATRRADDVCIWPTAFSLTLDNPAATSQSEVFTALTAEVGARELVEAGEALLQVALTSADATVITIDDNGVAPYERVLIVAPEQALSGGLATGRVVSTLLRPDAEGALELPIGRFHVVEQRWALTEPLAPMMIASASRAALGLEGALALAVTPLSGPLPASSSFLRYDPACTYALERPSVKVAGATALALDHAPSCVTPDASHTPIVPAGLLALHFGNAAAPIEHITAPTEARYSCDPAISEIADPDTCLATPDYRAYVHGPCRAVVDIARVGDAPLGLGGHAVSLRVTDPWGNATTCDTQLEVRDGAPPEVACGDIAAGLSAGMLPLDHAVTASDACGGAPEVIVAGYRCLITRAGEITHQLVDGCGAALDGPNMTVLAVDTPADLFEWTVIATDAAGNERLEQCYATVARDTFSARGSGGCGGGTASLVGLVAGALLAIGGRRRAPAIAADDRGAGGRAIAPATLDHTRGPCYPTPACCAGTGMTVRAKTAAVVGSPTS